MEYIRIIWVLSKILDCEIEIMMPPNILLMSNFESSYLINLISVVESVGSVSSGEEK